MTTATLAPTARPLGRRLWNVVRLHAANPFTILGTPLLVLATILAVNWLIWWVIRTATPSDPESVANVSEGFQYSGASLWVFVYMMVVAIMAMNHSFAFALGFGSTRRDFLLGSAVTFTGLAAFYAVVFSLLAAIESWTDGWGLGGTMFNAIWFGIGEPWYLRLFHVFALFLFFFGIGSAFGSIYVRWKARGIILFFSVLALALAALVALTTVTESWATFADVFVTLGFTGSYALSLVVAVVGGVAAYAILRKATPRS